MSLLQFAYYAVAHVLSPVLGRGPSKPSRACAGPGPVVYVYDTLAAGSCQVLTRIGTEGNLGIYDTLNTMTTLI